MHAPVCGLTINFADLLQPQFRHHRRTFTQRDDPRAPVKPGLPKVVQDRLALEVVDAEDSAPCDTKPVNPRALLPGPEREETRTIRSPVIHRQLRIDVERAEYIREVQHDPLACCRFGLRTRRRRLAKVSGTHNVRPHARVRLRAAAWGAYVRDSDGGRGAALFAHWACERLRHVEWSRGTESVK